MKKKNYLRLALLLAAVLANVTTVFADETEAVKQDFTGESTDVVDYGFTVTGSASGDMSAMVTDGKLVMTAGGQNSSRGFDAKTSFTAIPSGYEIVLKCTWATGNATGNNAYSRLILSDGTNEALNITYYGQDKYLSVNGESVASGVARDGTYEVSATLNTTTKKITALKIGSAYTLSTPIYFSSLDCKSISAFQFSHWTRATWVNTSSIDNLSITYSEAEALDPDYVEEIVSAEITGAEKMTFGPSPDEAYSNPYTVTIVGTDGTTLNEETISDKVTDFKVVWDIEGFKTTNDTEGQYCDSYGAFSVNNVGKVSTTFDLRNVPMNFFGKMTATVTYNGTTTKATKYVVAQGNLTKDASQVLPQAGYPADFKNYSDEILGYGLTGSSDLLLGGWYMAGSGGKSAVLSADGDGTKYIKFATEATGSHVMTRVIDSPTTQLIFRNRMRFNDANTVVTLTSKSPTWTSSSGYANPVSLSFDGSKLTLNGTALVSSETDVMLAKGKWYDVVLSVDKTNESCYVMVYDTNGELLGESGSVAWNETAIPTYYSIGIANSKAGSVDLASYEAFLPVVDAASYTLTADKTTLSIPNKDTATLTASVTDANGYVVTGLAAWSVLEEDMQETVIISSDSDDSHKATVTLAEGAEAGVATVQVNINGATKTIELNLTSSDESVKFTQSTTSITIPLDADDTATANFAAIVIDGDGNDIGSDVTLAVYDKEGVNPFTADGISFDPATGVLSVAATALPAQLTIRATGNNSKEQPISKVVRVNIHGLKFDFGTTNDDAVAEGFTAVGTSTAYSATAGYGIKSGTPTVGGTASATDATKDYLEGAIEFDFKATKGDFYTVEITYQGTLTTGYINTDLAGYELGNSETMTTATFTIPATQEVIDLRIADVGDAKARIAQISITKQAKRSKRGKRVVHHIGDSTSANNGSWAYSLKNVIGGTYPELAELCDFHNDGAGGRNLSTYYTQGKLAGVLRDIYPDDVVMFGNNGTNGMGSSFEADMNYYLDAAEALGAQIIINSYTPHGAVGSYTSGYNSTTNTFDSYRKDSYETIVRKVAAQREASDDNYLGFVEIGKNADAAFNAYVADYAKNGHASKDAAAQAIIACFTDHNHYSNGSLACSLMLGGYGDVKGIVAQMVDILSTPAVSKGDVNGDGKVDVLDVTQTIDYILGQTPTGFNAAAADVDGSGDVNVVDVTVIIDIVLGVAK